MELIMIESGSDMIRAGYQCTCGCSPSNTYRRGGEISTHICCCGNEFAVGVGAQEHVSAKDGFHLEVVDVEAPWGEPVTAAWMVGPGTHPVSAEGSSGGHAHGHSHDHGPGEDLAFNDGSVLDPVCGMSVQPPVALEKGLHSQYKGTDYFFCGKGCKLEFDDDPERYLDPAYIPSM